MAKNLIIAKTAPEAVEAKNSASAFLAGGTEAERLGTTVTADTLILLKNVPDLDRIEEADDSLKIGALCSFEKTLEDPRVPDYLKTALRFMAARTKRNMATVGGNISVCRSDSYLLPTLLASGAELEILGKDGEKKTIAVRDYIASKDACADCLITALLVRTEGISILSKRYANTAESHAALTVSMGKSGGSFSIGAAVRNAGIFTLDGLAEKMNSGSPMTEDNIVGWCRTWDGAEIRDDFFGSEAYKRYLLGVTLAKMYADLQGGDRK
jgi:putative selenate reductase FAD-binding subunit